MTILRRELLKLVALATNQDDIRFALSCVQVHPDGEVIATDGHWLLRGKEQYPFDAAYFPTKGMPEQRDKLSKPVLIAAAIIDKLFKATAKKPTIPILQAVLVAENGKPYAAATDLDVPLVATFEPTEQEELRFPETSRVLVPPDRPHIKLTISGVILEKLAKAAKQANGRTGGSVTFEIQTEPQHQTDGAIHDQVRFTVGGGEFEVDGVVMPMRV